MARKRKGPRAEGRGLEPVKLSVMVPGDLHTRLLILAALEHKTLGEIVVEALQPAAASVRMPSVSRKGESHGPAEDDGPDLPRVAG